MTDDVTIGEIHRRLVDIDERHSHQLNEIATQVRITNGRTTRLEERVTGHDHELKNLKRVDVPAPLPPELRELIDLARDARGVARFGKAMWAIGGAIVPIVIWLLSQVQR
ncbi:MAG TPA: hypothetical protein VEC57_15050 [Candidatus Limnocylindrales bacterium]|nr:hypothetical protein [Candidatus Limnocylindrales bacterium]